MASDPDPPVEWLSNLWPLRVDLVGDFAGSNLFIVHGDSLLPWCFEQAGVKLTDGFQLLHAVHSVEVVLQKLKERECIFDIVFFNDHADNHHLQRLPANIRDRFMLARSILIQHLQQVSGKSPFESQTHQFRGQNDPDFESYLKQRAVYFFLCSKYFCNKDEFACNLLTRGYNIALLDDIDFTASKVFASVYATGDYNPPQISSSPLVTVIHGTQEANAIAAKTTADDTYLTEVQDRQKDLYAAFQGESRPSAGLAIAIATLCQILSSDSSSESQLRVVAFLLHLVTLQSTSLSERTFGAESPLRKGDKLEAAELARDQDFMDAFCRIATKLVPHVFADHATAMWDTYDLIDGVIFSASRKFVSDPSPLAPPVFNETQRLVSIVADIVGLSVDLDEYLPPDMNSKIGWQPQGRASPIVGTQMFLLPFRHEAFEKYFASLGVLTSSQPSSKWTSIVSTETTHWHNATKTLNPKVTVATSTKLLRMNQKFMADTIAYSASLTGATGKHLEPETVTVSASQSLHPGNSSTSSGPHSTKNSKTKSNNGREAARKEIESTRARKSEDKARQALLHWKARLVDFDRESDLIKRYSDVSRYLEELSEEHFATVGAEVLLYRCNILFVVWQGGVMNIGSKWQLCLGNDVLVLTARQETQPAFSELSGFLWSSLQETSRANGMTVGVLNGLSSIRRAFGFPDTGLDKSLASPRDLAFSIIAPKAVGSTKFTIKDLLRFQLEFCGPYLPKALDAKPDERVPFWPDPWQRTCLDAIDANKSLFAVAPTSAGKTFMSFYAMKKVLQADDDSVLVYVAPNKALVNQIAAEVQARFSKSYRYDGRSVWAIHTRDYRINNPTGCQVLVTVPHILQIMLLSPKNADQPSSWSNRVKRIIFDEVHCIGQAEDGIVWEQLLLLAPCPIIALSATVGNPDEFCDWLRHTQKQKGFGLEMVVHPHRYSDLRKYTYRAPEKFEAEGLSRLSAIQIPGISNSGTVGKFAYIHPIETVRNRTTGLADSAFEPRETLILWECMSRCATPKFPLPASLDLEQALQPELHRSHVLEWEANLKDILTHWMNEADSPFEKLCDEIKKSNEGNMPEFLKGTKSTADKSGGMDTILSLLYDLNIQDALPALVFSYDRAKCEEAVLTVFGALESAEKKWKETDSGWKKKVADFEKWKAASAKPGKAAQKKKAKSSKKSRGDDGDDGDAEDKLSKLDISRDVGGQEASKWAAFNPDAPLPAFSFVDKSKLPEAEFRQIMWRLRNRVPEGLLHALYRGLGVHHAGMNRRYRQTVEMLFRKKFLRVVVATGTLALGINMPCKTVVFLGDSVYLTALNYRQASGRAGRRGFDLLGNVVFHGLPQSRVHEVMSSKLPDIRGDFPVSATLILRLFSLLHGTGQSKYAVNAAQSLLSQTRLFMGGPDRSQSIKHHMRFYIEYLRRQHLLSEEGTPLNFAGLVGHLYFTENSVFAFHSLLRDGYFHRLVRKPTEKALGELVLVLSHIFCRIRAPRPTPEHLELVQKSPSVVYLDPLPREAERILVQHNRETLSIFETYVRTYAESNLRDSPDRTLPYSGVQVGQPAPQSLTFYRPGPETVLRSPFAALSGATDHFSSIRDFCQGVRAGVFLEESAIPYLPIEPVVKADEGPDAAAPPGTTGLNAYLFDFYAHGDLKALVSANRIKSGDVWFRLKDFSLILATIVTSLTNFLTGGVGADLDMLDVQDAADRQDEDKDAAEAEAEFGGADAAAAKPPGRASELLAGQSVAAGKAKEKKKKKVVADSWEDDLSAGSGDDEDADDATATATTTATATSTRDGEETASTVTAGSDEPDPLLPAWEQYDMADLKQVLRLFSTLRDRFDEKFLKVWA